MISHSLDHYLEIFSCERRNTPTNYFVSLVA